MTARESPGVGGVVAETLAFFFTRLHWVLLAAVSAAVVAGAFGWVMFAREAMNLNSAIFRLFPFGGNASIILSGMLQVVPLGLAVGLLAGFLTTAHADAASGQRVRLRPALRVLRHRGPHLALTGGLIAVAGSMILGFMFTSLGIYAPILALPVLAVLLANHALILPVMALDGGWLPAARRSLRLLHRHRIAASLSLGILIAMALVLATMTWWAVDLFLGQALRALHRPDAAGIPGEVLSFLFPVLNAALLVLAWLIVTALPVIGLAVLRRRLIELSEGMQVEDALKVFS